MFEHPLVRSTQIKRALKTIFKVNESKYSWLQISQVYDPYPVDIYVPRFPHSVSCLPLKLHVMSNWPSSLNPSQVEMLGPANLSNVLFVQVEMLRPANLPNVLFVIT